VAVPSAVAAIPAQPDAPGAKHFLMIARQNWRTYRAMFLMVSLIYAAIGFSQRAGMRFLSQGDPRVSAGVTFSFALIFLLALPFLYFYSRLSYVVFETDCLTVHFPIRRVKVLYTDIEKVRIETMERLFDRPDRRRLNRGAVRKLASERAICLRIRDEEGVPQQLRRVLGARHVLEREVVLPISEPDAALATAKQRLAMRRNRPELEEEPGRQRRRHRKKRR
jgi:hypothetical protein